MMLRITALVIGAGVTLYRYARHRDEWGACAFYGFLAASAVHAIAGFGDGTDLDYEGLRRDR